MPQVEFYFVRCEGRGEQEKCTGLILLKLLAKPTSRTPACQVDIQNMCSTGTGQGTLLTFKLCSYLTTLPVPTMLHVRVDKCKETAAGFYVKLGFQKRALAGDALFLDVSQGSWREHVHERTGGVVDLLRETELLPVRAEPKLVNDYSPGALAPETREEVRETQEVLKFGPGARYLGTRVTVRGNGSCWLYAFMAGLGVCEHANPCALGEHQAEKSPTDADYKISEVIRRKMQNEVRSMRLGEESIQAMDARRVATRDKAGTYGGGVDDYAILSYLFNCTIVKLDQANAAQAIVYSGDAKGKIKRYDREQLTTALKDATEEEEPVVVVEFNGAHGEGGTPNSAGHFAGYKSPDACRPRIPPWLASALGKCSAK